MENRNIGMVLIHGAGLNSSVWDSLKREIQVSTLAIDFPNRQAGESANKHLNYNDYVLSAVSQIEKWKHSQFIIVAHSIGACVGLSLLSHFRDEIVGFAAIGSVIPPDGNSFVSALPVPQRWIVPVVMRLMGTSPPENIIEKELCNDLTTMQTGKVVSTFTPEARTLYTSKINYSLPDIPRLYVKLLKDNSVSPVLQEKMAENLKATVATLDSGHLPMLSRPAELGELLSGFLYKTIQNLTPEVSVKPAF